MFDGPSEEDLSALLADETFATVKLKCQKALKPDCSGLKANVDKTAIKINFTYEIDVANVFGDLKTGITNSKKLDMTWQSLNKYNDSLSESYFSDVIRL